MLEQVQTSKTWLDRVLDRIAPEPSAPESPSPPAVDQAEWDRSVDSHKVNTLTVRNVGLIVFNETSHSRMVTTRTILSTALAKKWLTW